MHSLTNKQAGKRRDAGIRNPCLLQKFDKLCVITFK